MITSPMHNAKWYGSVDDNGWCVIDVWWECGNMQMRQKGLLSPEQGEIFWPFISELAKAFDTELKTTAAQKAEQYAWWKRNSSMFA